MARRPFANRHELEEHHFHSVVLISVPLAALFLHAYLPRIWQPLGILDLPFIVMLYFAVSWRNAISGTLMGTAIGLLQDLPSNQYIGVNGMAKAIIGYSAASIGLKIDVENAVTRAVMSFGFCLLQSLLLFGIQRFLLDDMTHPIRGLHELLRAAINTAVAVPIFFLMDRTRMD